MAKEGQVVEVGKGLVPTTEISPARMRSIGLIETSARSKAGLRNGSSGLATSRQTNHAVVSVSKTAKHPATAEETRCQTSWSMAVAT